MARIYEQNGVAVASTLLFTLTLVPSPSGRGMKNIYYFCEGIPDRFQHLVILKAYYLKP